LVCDAAWTTRSEHLKGRTISGCSIADGNIILKPIVNRKWRCGLDSFGSGQRPEASSYEHGNEPSVPIHGAEFYRCPTILHHEIS
jgi:hypothetical protein